MFVRGKLRNFLKDNLAVKSNVDNYFKVIMNNQMRKTEYAADENYLRKSTASKHVEDDIRVFPADQYIPDEMNKDGFVPTISLRKCKIPQENAFLHDATFDAVKPNKNYAAAKEEDDNEMKNSVEDTFHRAARPVLFLGECFALMPVMNILNPNPKRLKFLYKSPQVLVFLTFMCSSSILTLTILKFLLKVGINAKNLVGFVFFFCVQCATLLFASLARRWPKIMRYWSKVEATFTQTPYEMPQRSLSRRIRVSASIIVICSAVEHGLFLCSAIVNYKRSIELCAAGRNYTEEVSFEDYVRRNYAYVFEILPYNMSVGIFILLTNACCTFIWNYMDLFIMMVSKGIAYRFEQITNRINQLTDKEVPETVFIEIREHYVKLCELLEFLDENLSGIILLSCMNNLYFVCYQLLNIFNKLRWPINYLYFWFSLLYLIGRTAFVFLSAASINDESKGGLPVLRKVSSRTWCVEVERLIFEMTTQTVALSGKKFYFLTRRLLFGMAGTIVTYELVLLQFDEPNRIKGLTALCG